MKFGGNIILISILEKVKFPKLKKFNNINDINVLKRIDFKEMNKLNLNDNLIDKKKNELTIHELN